MLCICIDRTGWMLAASPRSVLVTRAKSIKLNLLNPNGTMTRVFTPRSRQVIIYQVIRKFSSYIVFTSY